MVPKEKEKKKTKTKKDSKKRTSRCLIIKRVRGKKKKKIKREGATLTGRWGWFSERRLIPSPQSPDGRVPSFWRISRDRENFALLLGPPHQSSQETLFPVPGFLWPGESARWPMIPRAEAEAQATYARQSRSPGGCQRPTRCGYPGTSQPRDGRQGRLSGGVRQQRLGAHGCSGTPHRRGRAPLGARFFPTTPTPNSATPLGFGRAQIPGPRPCSSELPSGSSDLRPLYRCDSPIPLPQWTSVGGG